MSLLLSQPLQYKNANLSIVSSSRSRSILLNRDSASPIAMVLGLAFRAARLADQQLQKDTMHVVQASEENALRKKNAGPEKDRARHNYLVAGA